MDLQNENPRKNKFIEFSNEAYSKPILFDDHHIDQ